MKWPRPFQYSLPKWNAILCCFSVRNLDFNTMPRIQFTIIFLEDTKYCKSRRPMNKIPLFCRHKYIRFSYSWFHKKVLSVYTNSTTIIYLSLSAQLAKSTFFMKSPVHCTYIYIFCVFFHPDKNEAKYLKGFRMKGFGTGDFMKKVLQLPVCTRDR